MAQAVDNRVYRSHDVVIAGVCAGIAERYDLDPIVVRILAILLGILTGGLIAIVYIVLWARLPRRPEQTQVFDVLPERIESSAYGNLDYRSAVGGHGGQQTRVSLVARLAVAVGLMLLFLVVAVNVSPFVEGTRWWQFWPLAFIILGLCLIVVPIRTRYERAWHALGIAVTSLAAAMLPMSLGVFSWLTVPNACANLWVFIVVAAVLAVIGLIRGIDALVVAAAFCIAAFCVVALLAYGVPGSVTELTLTMPGGASMSIAGLAFS